MITLTRAQARSIRPVFRRRSLGLPPRGPTPSLLVVSGLDGHRVRWRGEHLAIELVLPGPSRSNPDSVAIPFDALADFDGRDSTPIALEAINANLTIARWTDRGIPVVREYRIDAPADAPSPPRPGHLETCPASLLAALAEAGEVAGEDSPRYALASIELDGDAGHVVATDGRQLLVRGGFALPWAGSRLVHASIGAICRTLPREPTSRIGLDEDRVVIESGPITLWIPIRSGLRFPRTDGILPDASAATTRLPVDPRDARSLVLALGRLPGSDGPNAPVTLDLGHEAVVRCHATAGDRPTELVLARSRPSGPPIRLATDRAHLIRALEGEPAELLLFGPEAPLGVRDPDRTYAWQPLAGDAAIEPSPDAVRLDTVALDTPAAPTRPVDRSRPTMSRPATRPVDRPEPAPAAGLAALIQEAEALNATLADARARSSRLVAALRRHRKQGRLVQETLRSLRELGLQDVAG